MNKIEYEQHTVKKMLLIYCRAKHYSKEQLCNECENLFNYAHLRLSKCKFGDDKPVCKLCPIHCYEPTNRQLIRKVMRYAGPRMILYHPIDSLKHMVKQLKIKPRK